MIAFFPEPYADELAYSLFARYHIHSGNISFRATAEDLFQNKDAIPNPEFFAPLSEEVCSIITRSSTMEDFIARHTMLPYYIIEGNASFEASSLGNIDCLVACDDA